MTVKKIKKIGLVWACGRHSHAQDRSVPLYYWWPLLRLQGYEFWSLQMPPDNGAIRDLGWQAMIHDASHGIKDFADTARLLQGLSAVVTVDTAMAHLAGAFHKKTFLLLPHLNDWRWDRTDPSCWYPSQLFIFHQPQFRQGNQTADQSRHYWHGTMIKLATKLDQQLAA